MTRDDYLDFFARSSRALQDGTAKTIRLTGMTDDEVMDYLHRANESAKVRSAHDSPAVMSLEVRCTICGRRLDQPDDPASLDCGGDCLACMEEAETIAREEHLDDG